MKLIIAGGRDFEDKVLAVNSFMALIAEVNYAEVNYTLIPTVTQTKNITEQNNDTKSIVVRENPFTEIVISNTKGDCHIGEFLANFYNIPVKRFIQDWDTLGIEADGLPSEYLRNAEMVQYSVSDYNDGVLQTGALLAFWDKESKGTEHMIKIAKQKGLLVKVVYY